MNSMLTTIGAILVYIAIQAILKRTKSKSERGVIYIIIFISCMYVANDWTLISQQIDEIKPLFYSKEKTAKIRAAREREILAMPEYKNCAYVDKCKQLVKKLQSESFYDKSKYIYLKSRYLYELRKEEEEIKSNYEEYKAAQENPIFYGDGKYRRRTKWDNIIFTKAGLLFLDKKVDEAIDIYEKACKSKLKTACEQFAIKLKWQEENLQ
jgi:hypothetical protein